MFDFPDVTKALALVSVIAVLCGIAYNITLLSSLNYNLFFLLSIHDEVSTAIPILIGVPAYLIFNHMTNFLVSLPQRESFKHLFYVAMPFKREKIYKKLKIWAEEVLADQAKGDDKVAPSVKEDKTKLSTMDDIIFHYRSIFYVALSYYLAAVFMWITVYDTSIILRFVLVSLIAIWYVLLFNFAFSKKMTSQAQFFAYKVGPYTLIITVLLALFNAFFATRSDADLRLFLKNGPTSEVFLLKSIDGGLIVINPKTKMPAYYVWQSIDHLVYLKQPSYF